MSRKIPDSTNVAFEAVISTPFSQYLVALAAKYSKNVDFKRLQALFTLVYMNRSWGRIAAFRC